MCEQIGAHGSIDRLRIDLHQRIVVANARIVDQDRDAAESIDDLCERALHLIVLGHVGLYEQRQTTVVTDIVHQIVAVRIVDVQHDHPGAQLTELNHQLTPQTLRTA